MDYHPDWEMTWTRPLTLVVGKHTSGSVSARVTEQLGGPMTAGRTLADCPSERAARAAMRLLLLETPEGVARGEGR